MDTKITLSFNKEIIDNAKQFAETHNISLSRLTEYIFRQITSSQYQNLEDLPISEWVSEVAEGKAVYERIPRSRSALKSEYMKSRKWKFFWMPIF